MTKGLLYLCLLALASLSCGLATVPVRNQPTAKVRHLTENISQSECVVVTAERLNLREAPSEHSPANAKGLLYHDVLRVTGEDAGWLQVQTEDGRSGWVNGNEKYVKEGSCE